MKPRINRPLAISGLLLMVSSVMPGCASTSPDQDARFGQAAHTLNEQQRLHPDASTANQNKPVGADGRLVRASSERAVDSYRTPLKLPDIGVSNNNGASR